MVPVITLSALNPVLIVGIVVKITPPTVGAAVARILIFSGDGLRRDIFFCCSFGPSFSFCRFTKCTSRIKLFLQFSLSFFCLFASRSFFLNSFSFSSFTLFSSRCFSSFMNSFSVKHLAPSTLFVFLCAGSL